VRPEKRRRQLNVTPVPAPSVELRVLVAGPIGSPGRHRTTLDFGPKIF
jgi:hypothetical protein